MTTCERGFGAAGLQTASRYITADTPEITASQEISSSLSTVNTQTAPPHNTVDQQNAYVYIGSQEQDFLSDISGQLSVMPTFVFKYVGKTKS